MLETVYVCRDVRGGGTKGHRVRGRSPLAPGVAGAVWRPSVTSAGPELPRVNGAPINPDAALSFLQRVAVARMSHRSLNSVCASARCSVNS
ncbi:hypothetical protein EYF80_063651 [Liparis tanakae]|uniref:Uncharacterized protein n=1 Tax=Liparis tanakae TaxID=230148 RepID=A0A4Z2ED50_9TELE|nr:hypothetical protein EYF80_063651 [Liparis tanakae]